MLDRSHAIPLAVSLLLVTASSALSQTTTVAPAAGIDTGALAAELARVLAFVIVIESAMSAVFNWRLYRVLLGGHAMQTPIMVLVGFLVVSLFDYDIVARLLHITMPSSAQPASNWLSMTLSALVIAGGSNGSSPSLPASACAARWPVQMLHPNWTRRKRGWRSIWSARTCPETCRSA